MATLQHDRLASRLRSLFALGADNQAIEGLLAELTAQDIALVLAELDEQETLLVFSRINPGLAATVLGAIDPERLRFILSEADLGLLAPRLALISSDASHIAPHVAEALVDLPADRRLAVFRCLPRVIAAETFSNLDPETRDALLHSFTDSDARRVLTDLSPDDRTFLFEELPGQVTQRLLNLLGPEELKESRRLLGYPEKSVGRLMTPEYVAVRDDWTVEQVLRHVREQAKRMRRETYDVLYVTDDRWRLLDALALQKFVVAAPGSLVRDLMDRSFVAIEAREDQEAAVAAMRRYDVAVLPVVDSDGVLLGIVTSDDVLDVAEEEATEDFRKMGSVAMAAESLRDATVAVLWRARVGWLMALVVVNVFTGAGIALFESTLEKTIALVFFLPLLIGSAGNAGSQSATMMVRALATGDVQIRDWLRLFGREVVVAGSLGATMAAGVAVIASIRAPEVIAVVAVTMVVVVLIGSLLGMSLPFLLTILTRDPATASTPLIASLADIVGVLIYFTVASLILGN
ncbi:MAG: magnesium transporter [Fimbriimonadaceae bacterium]